MDSTEGRNLSVRAAAQARIKADQEHAERYSFDTLLEAAQTGNGIARTAGVLREYVANRGARPWLIKGVVRPGWIVKIAAPPKCGKGELAVHLIAALERGEPSVFDSPSWRPAEQYTTLIVTEEPDDLLTEKLEHHDVRRAGVIFDYELDERLERWSWDDAVQVICAEAVAGGHSIIFLDNISALTHCTDEAGVELAGYLNTLKLAARQHGLTVIVDHHHRKAGGAMSDKSRGSTSINGKFDNNLDLNDPRPDDPDNRVRKVYSKGRGDGTRWSQQITLLEDKSGYRRAETGEAVQLTAKQAALLEAVVEAASEQGIATLDALGASTRDERRNLTKQLDRLVEKGVLERAEDGWIVAKTDTQPAI